MDEESFRVWVDEVPAETQPVTTTTTILSEAAGINLECTTQWRSFAVVFPPGRDVRIRVSYTMSPGDELAYPWDSFTYVLKTGEPWYGTIGRVDFSLELPYEIGTDDLLKLPAGYRRDRQHDPLALAGAGAARKFQSGGAFASEVTKRSQKFVKKSRKHPRMPEHGLSWLRATSRWPGGMIIPLSAAQRSNMPPSRRCKTGGTPTWRRRHTGGQPGWTRARSKRSAGWRYYWHRSRSARTTVRFGQTIPQPG